MKNKNKKKKNNKITIASIIIMVVGLVVLLVGLFDVGNISKLKGSITDESAEFKVTFACEKTTINVGEQTLCIATIHVGDNNQVSGLQGSVVGDTNITIGKPELLLDTWDSMGVGMYYTTLSNTISGSTELLRFTVTGAKEGTGAINMVPYGDLLQVGDGNKNSHDLTSVPLIITVSNENPSSNDNTLKSLTVNQGTLTPEFDKNVTEYNVSVPNNIELIKVSAEATDSDATVEGTGDYELEVGDNSIEVEVTSESGESKVYKITVKRDADSTNYAETDLKSITINNGKLVPEFNKDVTTYTIEVDSSVSEIGV